MVAKITTPSTLNAALNYNENKVAQGKAECLHASGYLREVSDMNFYQKLEGFERLNKLNDRATTKTLHISLNFDPSEKLSNNKLIEIANKYMEMIGFGDQPFLVYKHKDAGHPHIHLVTTTIQADGKRINTHNIGRNQSEKARKEIENLYGLVKAENQKRSSNLKIIPANAEKVNYGKTETKTSINNVVSAVVNTYLFASLPEFNAILKGYNVVADRGEEDGRIYKHRGLVYRILDSDGNKIGVPIKSSLLLGKPTLDKLENLFEKNKALKETFRMPLKKSIDDALSKKPNDMNELINLLGKLNISVVLRHSEEGRIYGITFVDHSNKTVFNGSEVGKAYSAAHLIQKLTTNKTQEPKQIHKSNHQELNNDQSLNSNLLEILLTPQNEFDYTPGQLLKKKRKRKKRSLGL